MWQFECHNLNCSWLLFDFDNSFCLPSFIKLSCMKYLTYHNKPHIHPPCFVLTHWPLVTIKSTVHPFKILHFHHFCKISSPSASSSFTAIFLVCLDFFSTLAVGNSFGPFRFLHSSLILMVAVSIQLNYMLLFLLLWFPDEEEVLTLLLRVRRSNNNYWG